MDVFTTFRSERNALTKKVIAFVMTNIRLNKGDQMLNNWNCFNMCKMNGCCGDNRFEIIAEYKERLLKETNIDSSPEEMAVLDNILYRIWQMGWIPKTRMPTSEEIEKAKNEFIPVPDGGRSELQAWALSGFERGVWWLLDFLNQQRF